LRQGGREAERVGKGCGSRVCRWERFGEFFLTGRATGEELQGDLIRGVCGA